MPVPTNAWRHPLNKNPLSLVLAAAGDKKAEEIVVLDLRGLSSITDHFIICHGHSTRQTQAVSDHIEEVLKEAKIRPINVEGYGTGEWILMDYVDFVVHVFTKEKRDFYSLERLWSDAPRVAPEGLASRKPGRRAAGEDEVFDKTGPTD